MAGEARQVRLPCMTTTAAKRLRPTELAREAARLSATIAATLGRDVRAARQGRRLTQAALGERIGVHQTRISRIELGQGETAPLATWIALGAALERPLAVSLSRPLGVPREPVDAGHLAMQEYLISRATATGRTAQVEVPTNASAPTYSIDVVIVDATSRTVILVEAWNAFGDVGAAIRTTRRKLADLIDRGAVHDRRGPFSSTAAWVVRDSATNRALLRRYPGIVRSVFSGPSRAWVRALEDGSPPPADPGLVWFDGASSALRAWRVRAAAPELSRSDPSRTGDRRRRPDRAGCSPCR